MSPLAPHWRNALLNPLAGLEIDLVEMNGANDAQSTRNVLDVALPEGPVCVEARRVYGSNAGVRDANHQDLAHAPWRRAGNMHAHP
eukprot:CAMPEP_0179145714 /NCGR_PEP_ID=MMETSP0796-20121207/70322_1 /TAXON_ID=73915 /ORGANISM="Pyrodinium bahamense, Strain pbaha01" /LENGTH=85 /DNA_ID=CAMNT_0020846133 /DNA_START=336 /DNA_END=593 /DNA_ORIENTATION=+